MDFDVQGGQSGAAPTPFHRFCCLIEPSADTVEVAFCAESP